MQINIRIGAGAILMSTLLFAGAWYAHDHGVLLQAPKQSATATGGIGEKDPEFIPTNGGVLTIA